jgi:phosphatidylinositol alpha-1,6-mannosyltransferase
MTGSLEEAIDAAVAAPACPADAPGVLLLSELFPPAVGGSAVLLAGIYSRLPLDVLVVTDAVTSPGAVEERRGRLRVVRRAIATRRWGVFDVTGVGHHLRVAWYTRTLGAKSIVHCARALPEGLAAAIARTAGGPPFVCWTHGEDLVSASTSRELSSLTKWVYRRAAAAVANSRNTARLLLDIGVPKDKIEVVYPAVDASRFHPGVDGRHLRRRLSLHDDTVLLLSVGRLQRRKGHDVTLGALSQVGGEVPRWHYAIVGDGQERKRLERLAADYGVADRVTFVGEVDDEELPAWYAASDIFIMPNRVDEGDIEGFGIVFLEAAAAGRPVIGGDSGGVPEAVERDETGLLVDGTNPQAVAEAIRALASAPHVRARLGQAGRDRVIRRFTWARAAEQVRSLHARVAAGG